MTPTSWPMDDQVSIDPEQAAHLDQQAWAAQQAQVMSEGGAVSSEEYIPPETVAAADEIIAAAAVPAKIEVWSGSIVESPAEAALPPSIESLLSDKPLTQDVVVVESPATLLASAPGSDDSLVRVSKSPVTYAGIAASLAVRLLLPGLGWLSLLPAVGAVLYGLRPTPAPLPKERTA